MRARPRRPPADGRSMRRRRAARCRRCRRRRVVGGGRPVATWGKLALKRRPPAPDRDRPRHPRRRGAAARRGGGRGGGEATRGGRRGGRRRGAAPGVRLRRLPRRDARPRRPRRGRRRRRPRHALPRRAHAARRDRRRGKALAEAAGVKPERRSWRSLRLAVRPGPEGRGDAYTAALDAVVSAAAFGAADGETLRAERRARPRPRAVPSRWTPTTAGCSTRANGATGRCSRAPRRCALRRRRRGGRRRALRQHGDRRARPPVVLRRDARGGGAAVDGRRGGARLPRAPARGAAGRLRRHHRRRRRRLSVGEEQASWRRVAETGAAELTRPAERGDGAPRGRPVSRRPRVVYSGVPGGMSACALWAGAGGGGRAMEASGAAYVRNATARNRGGRPPRVVVCAAQASRARSGSDGEFPDPVSHFHVTYKNRTERILYQFLPFTSHPLELRDIDVRSPLCTSETSEGSSDCTLSVSDKPPTPTAHVTEDAAPCLCAQTTRPAAQPCCWLGSRPCSFELAREGNERNTKDQWRGSPIGRSSSL